jgi:ribonuclease R
MMSDLVLRSQAQAVYSPENIGHFGLALPRYCHFTSPIRRYADLLVHRALIASHGFGADGLRREDGESFPKLGEQISATERRAATAERDATDRYVAAYLGERVGDILTGRISGVTRFGLFVLLDDSGGSGLVPISSLPSDFYDHDERCHSLVGRRHGRRFQLGERVAARLVEATPITGGLVLQLIEGEESAERVPPTRPLPRSGQPQPGSRAGKSQRRRKPGTAPRRRKGGARKGRRGKR